MSGICIFKVVNVLRAYRKHIAIRCSDIKEIYEDEDGNCRVVVATGNKGDIMDWPVEGTFSGLVSYWETKEKGLPV